MLAAAGVKAYLTIVFAMLGRWLPWPALLVLVSIPRAVSQLQMVFRETAVDRLNEAWFRGIQLHLEFGIALLAGLLVAALLRG